MVTQAYTVAFQGVKACEIEVQCQLSNGLPTFTIVGLADKAVAESKERVRAALHALSIALPPKRITINLAPADMPKEGSHYDLPIAISLLAALDIIPHDTLEDYTIIGELSLDGRINPVAGALPAALGAMEQERGLVCPYACAAETAILEDMNILAPKSLLELINHFQGKSLLKLPDLPKIQHHQSLPDLRDVKGQESAKRALEIAAAGGHNMLMSGPPGAGKSMLAARLQGLLPQMNAKESLEVSMIHSLAGLTQGIGCTPVRPFCAPHHSASMAAMVGGGRRALPGEISLAHCGVLFLDEMPEFSRTVLDSLRQPLETGETTIARANAHVSYPSRIQLIAAMNPCKCGFLSDPARACSRAPRCAQDYQSKISGPLLDRIDIVIDVPPVTASSLMSPPPLPKAQKTSLPVSLMREPYRKSVIRVDCSMRIHRVRRLTLLQV
jgi:magnesium chelatase family protein